VPTASAHLGHIVLRAERYLKVDVSSTEARVVVSLTLGADEARRVMAAADADGDGTVARAEADAYMAEWGEGLETDLPISVDGETVEVAWGEPFFDPIGPVRGVPATVEMVAHVPLEEGRHRITLHDRMRVEKYDRTDMAFRARGGARLVASGSGLSPDHVVRDLAYGRELPAATEGGRFTAVVELPERREADRALGRWIALGATAALFLVAGAILLGRRLRRG